MFIFIPKKLKKQYIFFHMYVCSQSQVIWYFILRQITTLIFHVFRNARPIYSFFSEKKFFWFSSFFLFALIICKHKFCFCRWLFTFKRLECAYVWVIRCGMYCFPFVVRKIQKEKHKIAINILLKPMWCVLISCSLDSKPNRRDHYFKIKFAGDAIVRFEWRKKRNSFNKKITWHPI